MAESPRGVLNVGQQNDQGFDQQVLAVMAFLGGIAFAGLVFILQSPGQFRVPVGILSAGEYFGFITTDLAVASILCIFAGLGLASVGSGQPDVTRWSGPFSLICALIGICALLVAIPLLLLPFTLPGAYFIAALEFVLLILAVRFHTF